MTPQSERVAAIVATVLIVGSLVRPVLHRGEGWSEPVAEDRAFCGERDGEAWILVACVALGDRACVAAAASTYAPPRPRLERVDREVLVARLSAARPYLLF
jgi:hypothetical protein